MLTEDTKGPGGNAGASSSGTHTMLLWIILLLLILVPAGVHARGGSFPTLAFSIAAFYGSLGLLLLLAALRPQIFIASSGPTAPGSVTASGSVLHDTYFVLPDPTALFTLALVFGLFGLLFMALARWDALLPSRFPSILLWGLHLSILVPVALMLVRLQTGWAADTETGDAPYAVVIALANTLTLIFAGALVGVALWSAIKRIWL